MERDKVTYWHGISGKIRHENRNASCHTLKFYEHDKRKSAEKPIFHAKTRRWAASTISVLHFRHVPCYLIAFSLLSIRKWMGIGLIKISRPFQAL